MYRLPQSSSRRRHECFPEDMKQSELVEPPRFWSISADYTFRAFCGGQLEQVDRKPRGIDAGMDIRRLIAHVDSKGRPACAELAPFWQAVAEALNQEFVAPLAHDRLNHAAATCRVVLGAVRGTA